MKTGKRGCRAATWSIGGGAMRKVGLVYRLWWTKPIMGLDPDECGHDDDGLHEDGWYG